MENLKKLDRQREEDDRNEEFRRVQQENPFNWIEHKITATLMGINRPGMNPIQFRWGKKDTKIATEQIKMHSGLKGDPFNRFCEFYYFAVEKIKSHVENMELPNFEEIKHEVSTHINDTLSERLNRTPNSQEVKDMIEGEKYKVAKKIALKIGSLLDEALYLRFRQNRNRRNN
ncbi:MAG: hypothetical protein ACTSPU_14720 [Promethearchaeota archaeon]